MARVVPSQHLESRIGVRNTCNTRTSISATTTVTRNFNSTCSDLLHHHSCLQFHRAARIRRSRSSYVLLLTFLLAVAPVMLL